MLVRGCGACRAVSGGLHSGAALIDVRLDVGPLPPRSSSPTVAGCRLGGFLLDVIGGVESALWEGCYPASTLAPTCGATGVYERWCSSTLHIGWGSCDRVSLVLVGH